MEISQKIVRLQTLSSDRVLRVELFYDVLDECGDLKLNYADYASTHPIDCRQELQKLPSSDYDTCCALLTMLLREDHFCEGALIKRIEQGDVASIIERMIHLLQQGEV